MCYANKGLFYFTLLYESTACGEKDETSFHVLGKCCCANQIIHVWSIPNAVCTAALGGTIYSFAQEPQRGFRDLWLQWRCAIGRMS